MAWSLQLENFWISFGLVTIYYYACVQGFYLDDNRHNQELSSDDDFLQILNSYMPSHADQGYIKDDLKRYFKRSEIEEPRYESHPNDFILPYGDDYENDENNEQISVKKRYLCRKMYTYNPLRNACMPSLVALRKGRRGRRSWNGLPYFGYRGK